MSSSNSSKEELGDMYTSGGGRDVHNSSSSSSNNNDFDDESSSYVVVKGKRTKRQRLHHSPAPPVSSMTSNDSAQVFSGATTEEEEDMANCLILLAQGRRLEPKVVLPVDEKPITGRRPIAEAKTTAVAAGAGFYMYECKTCFRRFPSFQALGGHRTSHKKPKIAAAAAVRMMEEKKAMEEENLQIIGIATFPKQVVLPNNNNINNGNSSNKPRVHECSICGSEFSSGQALGGHMRRHRPVTTTTTAILGSLVPDNHHHHLSKKGKSTPLSLDLNLPAPSDDHEHGSFAKSGAAPSSFNLLSAGKPPPLHFSTSSLVVDCHY